MTKPRLEFTVLKPTRIRYFFTSFVYHFSDKLFFRVTFCLPQTSETVAKTCCKKDVLGNFAKFTEKHLCQFLFFNKVAGLRHAALSKKRNWHSRTPSVAAPET